MFLATSLTSWIVVVAVVVHFLRLVPLVSIVVEISLPLIIVMIVVMTVLSSSTSLSSPIVSLVRLVIKSFFLFFWSRRAWPLPPWIG